MPTASTDRAGVSDFAHLHLHTQYSLLDGAIRMRDLCKTVRERGMSSVAMTDHGNMFGAVHFYQEAKKHGVKPIFGCEAYLADGDAPAKTDRKNYHIVLLAKNETGYRNLQRLVSWGHLRGFYYNPRVDRKMLREHSEGLIGLSACLGGHISRLISAGDMDAARERVLEYKSIFEPGAYYLELQPNGMEAQEKVNAALAQLGRELDVPLVATNDCHYVDRSEAHAHEVLMCLGMRTTLADPRRIRHECDEYFIKTPDEVNAYFTRYPDAFDNACRIAKSCNVELELGRPELPEFALPEGEESPADYLRKVARMGLKTRLLQLRGRGRTIDEAQYWERLERELQIIIKMDFPGYFLIVWDFIRHAKRSGVPVGPGRGSGAGSLVAYSMEITDIDPLEYDLLFERFLNPHRVSMPDFDIDFCMDRREEVIQYVTERYGSERVGQIATFHSLKARGLVRDVCRVMDLSVAEANELAQAIPEGPKVSLSMCMEDAGKLKAKAKKNPSLAGKLEDAIKVAEGATKLRQRAELSPQIAKVLEVGCALEGLNRHAGMHAAGIVIGKNELWEHVPCFSLDGKLVTQYTMTDVESAGLVKFDFLGLKTLTVIATAVRIIRSLPGRDGTFDIDTIAMDEAGVFEMISRGDTTGVFQLESSGFKELLTKLRPDCFADIIAAVALYRPGPLEGGMVDQFIDCKHGRAEITYPHDLLEAVLKETYGVFVYQEQVMQAAQVLAGFSLASADEMRRAMGKKKVEEMARQRQLFVDGCAETNGIEAAKAEEIFDLIDKFAGYGFNKSHSAAYGLITYQTAYLKHHFPVPFMAALMTCDREKIENVVKFVAEARTMGIQVLGPDVNESDPDFGVVARETGEQSIRFGLGAIRNVGSNAAQSIIDGREDGGRYESVFDLCRRVDLRRVNKRTLEALVHAGALDSISEGHHRAMVLGAVESAVDQGQSSQRDRESGQASLFGLLESPESAFVESYPECEAWSPRQKLEQELEAIGFYLTGHPLDRFQQDIDRHATARILDLEKRLAGKDVVVAGVIREFKEILTRRGNKPMAFFTLEDHLGSLETVVFPKTYAQVVDEETGKTFGEWLIENRDEPMFVTGKLEVELDDEGEVSRYKILADKIRMVTEVREERTKGVVVRIKADELDEKRVLALKHVVADHGGPCTMRLHVEAPGRFGARICFGDEFKVSADDALFLALERLFGRAVAQLA